MHLFIRLRPSIIRQSPCVFQIDEKLQLDKERVQTKSLPGEIKKVSRFDPGASITPGWDEEDDEVKAETVDQKLQKRANQILKNVWIEYDTRMYAKSTSKGDFFDQNRQMAMDLARKEYDEEQSKLQEKEV